MSKVTVAALAVLMLSIAPAAIADEIVIDDLFVDEPIVLQIAEGEQVYCADAGLKKVGEDEYVFTLEETPENEDLCVAPDFTVW